MKNKIKNLFMAAAFGTAVFTVGCTLDEYNPTATSMEEIASTVSGYETILDNIYFGFQRAYYGAQKGMHQELAECDSDLWTWIGNENTNGTAINYFWFFAGASPSTTYINDFWDCAYDGIGSCNMAIKMAAIAPYKTDAERNAKVAEAYFMRAVYFFHLVEQFGGVAMLTQVLDNADNTPVRTDPMTIYREVIIPDLQFAFEWLPKGDDTAMTRPTKKSALGFLAKAGLQTKYYGTDEFLQTAMDAAEKLINDAEGGGSQYGAYMYPNLADVFDDNNNLTNREALYKNRISSDPNGSSRGARYSNMAPTNFTCGLGHFGAHENTDAARLDKDAMHDGTWMPTQHLLSLYVQEDGTLDPRFHQWFNTQWKGNTAYTWSADAATNYRKDASVVEQTIDSAALAIKFVMPQDADYETEVANKATSKYLLVDYKDVYDDAKKKVIDTYNGIENQFHYFYPSLNKFNTDQTYVVPGKPSQVAYTNATLIMRMAEVYLIAAELDIYLNDGAQAMTYINKVRSRAGANPLTGTATLRTVLDERGRELCGEYTRFYDLKRTGVYNDASYLQEVHPDLAKYFNVNYTLRPISTTFLTTIFNAGEWQNPGY